MPILFMASPKAKGCDDRCIDQQAGKSVGQILVPRTSRHTFASDVTGSRAPLMLIAQVKVV